MTEAPTLSPQELDIMAHATGWDRGVRHRLSRNSYVAPDNGDAWPAIERLCALGLMKLTRKATPKNSHMATFRVTPAGIAELKRSRP